MTEVKTYRVIPTKNALGYEYVEPYASWLTATEIGEEGRPYSLIVTSAKLTEDGWIRPAPTEQTR